MHLNYSNNIILIVQPVHQPHLNNCKTLKLQLYMPARLMVTLKAKSYQEKSMQLYACSYILYVSQQSGGHMYICIGYILYAEFLLLSPGLYVYITSQLSNFLICPHVCTHTELVYKNNMTESEESSVNDKGLYLTKACANQCFFVE